MNTRTAVRLTSSYSKEVLILEVNEVVAVEKAESNHDDRKLSSAKTKVYTRTKGNFYVDEPTEPVAKIFFTEILTVGK